MSNNYLSQVALHFHAFFLQRIVLLTHVAELLHRSVQFFSQTVLQDLTGFMSRHIEFWRHCDVMQVSNISIFLYLFLLPYSLQISASFNFHSLYFAPIGQKSYVSPPLIFTPFADIPRYISNQNVRIDLTFFISRPARGKLKAELILREPKQFCFHLRFSHLILSKLVVHTFHIVDTLSTSCEIFLEGFVFITHILEFTVHLAHLRSLTLDLSFQSHRTVPLFFHIIVLWEWEGENWLDSGEIWQDLVWLDTRSRFFYWVNLEKIIKGSENILIMKKWSIEGQEYHSNRIFL